MICDSQRCVAAPMLCQILDYTIPAEQAPFAVSRTFCSEALDKGVWGLYVFTNLLMLLRRSPYCRNMTKRPTLSSRVA